jgi:hypothetical protein
VKVAAFPVKKAMSYTVEQYRKGLPFTAEARANAERTVNFINDVMNSMPGELRISSTVRDAKHNAEVGGVANSKHLNTRALAVDFMPIDGKFTAARKNKLFAVCQRHEFGLLVHNVSSGLHYHCEYKGKKK